MILILLETESVKSYHSSMGTEPTDVSDQSQFRFLPLSWAPKVSCPLFQPDILFHYINGFHPLFFLKHQYPLFSDDFLGASIHMKMFLTLVRIGLYLSRTKTLPIPALAPEISLRSKIRQPLLYRYTCLQDKLLQLYPTLCDIMDCGCQAPLSMGFSGKNSGVGCHPPPGDLPDPGIEPTSFMLPALAGRFFTTSTTWEVPTGIHPGWTCLLYVDPPAVETTSFLFFTISNSCILQGHLHDASQFPLVCSDIIMLLWSHSSIVWIT